MIRSKQFEKKLIGDVVISGSLSVLGTGVFIQSSSEAPALIVSGSEVIVRSSYSGSTYSASLSIQGLGTFADTGSNAIIDLGNESF
jgi:hypothetical protein